MSAAIRCAALLAAGVALFIVGGHDTAATILLVFGAIEAVTA